MSSSPSGPELHFHELSTGQKLSLKGQLFDLGKKLSAIDSEKKKNTEEYNFQPTISKFDLPNRNEDFISNIQRAEAIRKQKLQMLKANIEREQRDGLTFVPAVNRQKSSKSEDKRPFHERLTSKALEYRQKQVERVQRGQVYDLTNGKKMFQPEMKSSPYVDLPSNISADEFLYRDARDREERMRQRMKYATLSTSEQANTKKINTTSKVLLKQKAEREIREIFDIIDQRKEGVLVYDDIHRAVELIGQQDSAAYARLYKIAGRVWTVLDPEKAGNVSFETFMKCFYPFAHRNALTMAWTDNIPSTDGNPPQPSAEDGGAIITDTNLALKAFFKDMLAYVIRSHVPMDNTKKFQPVITNRSRILGKVKDKKDKEKILQLLAESKINGGNDNNDNDDDASQTNNGNVNSNASVASTSISESLSLAAMNGNIHGTDLMFARHLLTQEKRKSVRQQVHDEIMGPCTFKPVINKGPLPWSSSGSYMSKRRSLKLDDQSITSDMDEYNSDHDSRSEQYTEEQQSMSVDRASRKSSNVHERLYAQKDRPRPIAQLSQALIEELQECTFKPNIIHRRRPKRLKKKVSITVPVNSKDFEKSVNRMKQAREDRLKSQEVTTENNKFNDETYQQSRKLAAKGAVPFRFTTDERIEHRVKLEQQKKTRPKLYIDVQLGPTRVGNMKIKEGEDPAVVARDFCRIYGLDDAAYAVLVAATRQSMSTHHIAMADTHLRARENLYDQPEGIDKDIESLQSFESGSEDDSYTGSDDDYYSEDEEGEDEYVYREGFY